jgi:predicted TIM-barrel fold metal-dependent hydrolase
MYLFDANCAVGTWPTDRVVCETVGELSTEMERLGIERALVSHTLGQHYDPPEANRILMRELRGSDHLFPCWTLLPLSCGEMGSLDELLAGLAASDVRAVRFYPRLHSYSMDEWQCGELLSALSERRYVVLMDLDQIDWTDVDRICGTYPELSLVLTQTGYRQLRALLGVMDRHKNLYCDLSNFSTYLGVEEVLERYGGHRLLFGTGLPASDPGGPIARVLYTDAPEADVEAIAHSNLERLMARVRTDRWPGEEGDQ